MNAIEFVGSAAIAAPTSYFTIWALGYFAGRIHERYAHHWRTR